MKLLIVDDEPTIVTFLKEVAGMEGDIDIETANSGEEALACVVQNSYDLITLDLQMPGASGLEILSLLRNMCPHAVISIISGHVGETELPEIAGCADVIIQKPITLDKFTILLGAVRDICARMEIIRELGDVALPSSSQEALSEE